MRYRIFAAVTILSILLIPVTGCVEDRTALDPSETNGDEATLEMRISGTSELAFKLYHEIRTDEDNFLLSPHSLAVAFGMVYAGAMGETEREMAEALCFDYPHGIFHAAMKELNALLQSRGEQVDPESFRLNLTNGCWGRDDLVYLGSYTDLLLEYYGAGLEYMDFVNHPNESREAINQWVEDQTEGKIEDLIPEGAIDAYTYLVLANTIYFKASWLSQFDPECTWEMPFHLIDGTTVNAPTMGQMTKYPFVDGEGYKALELPYVGEEVSMLILLPDKGSFAAFEESLTPGMVDGIVNALDTTFASLALPKFSFSSDFDMKPVLENMGMTGAFYEGANFTGMDGVNDGSPFISFVAQKTFIAIDEAGTEAAAATGIGMSLTSAGEIFNVDRPFIFAIRDIETGTIIFLGRVVNPTL
ncbi:MAG: serpin family protein [Candidatus Krumholzibacteria bacterium]|nr:serpin family protein [Candidatus Krumholzibacteria bacterium]